MVGSRKLRNVQELYQGERFSALLCKAPKALENSRVPWYCVACRRVFSRGSATLWGVVEAETGKKGQHSTEVFFRRKLTSIETQYPYTFGGTGR